MADNPVSWLKNGHVMHITLNSGQGAGLVDIALSQKLGELSRQINSDREIYLVILNGNSEGNYPQGYGQDFLTALLSPDWPDLMSPSHAIASILCPTLAVIRREAVSGGLEIALACDLRIASEKARLGMPQVTEGMFPIDGGTQRLSRVAGKAKALELVLTGEILNAQSAFESGLVNRVVPESELDTEVEKVEAAIAAKAPLAARFCKEAVNQGLELTLEQGLRLEADLYFLLHTTSDRAEGVASFLEKRTPKYQGK